jgi:hypothetical protein
MRHIKETDLEPLKGFETRYTINRKGEIYDTHRQRFLKPSYCLNKNTNQAYYLVKLNNKDKSKSYALHRLVAQQFIKNPHNKETVDFIDRDTRNVSMFNLRWATYGENNLNRDTWKHGTSSFKGVTKMGKKWMAKYLHS